MIESVLTALVFMVCLVVVSISYGVAKQKNKQQKEDLQTGEKIDKIISSNRNISDNDWATWMQERNDK